MQVNKKTSQKPTTEQKINLIKKKNKLSKIDKEGEKTTKIQIRGSYFLREKE